jgi:hypothetical protein
MASCDVNTFVRDTLFDMFDPDEPTDLNATSHGTPFEMDMIDGPLTMEDDIKTRSLLTVFFPIDGTDERGGLIQRMSQLSASEGEMRHSNKKRRRQQTDATTSTDPTIYDDAILRTYIDRHRATTASSSFDATLRSDDLHRLALVRHQLGLIRLEHTVWQLYLQMGTGHYTMDTLDITSIHGMQHCYWAKEIRDAFDEPSSSSTLYQDHVQQKLTHVRTQLSDLEQQYEHCVSMAAATVSRQIVEDLVENYGLVSVRAKHEARIHLLKFDFTFSFLHELFQHGQPDHEQVRLSCQYIRTCM